MTLPSNGITADVFRDCMPPYHLSLDLVHATFAALPPPPPDASPAWRHARITRLTQEILAFRPADAAQARLATQMLVLREQADRLSAAACAPEVTIKEMCRLSRISGELTRTAALLDRTLARHQQKPVPFFGTVVEDEVDIAAVDAAWGNAAGQPPAAGERDEGHDRAMPAGGVASGDAPVPPAMAGGSPGRVPGDKGPAIAAQVLPGGDRGDPTAGKVRRGMAGSGPAMTNKGHGDMPAFVPTAGAGARAAAGGAA